LRLMQLTLRKHIADAAALGSAKAMCFTATYAGWWKMLTKTQLLLFSNEEMTSR